MYTSEQVIARARAIYEDRANRAYLYGAKGQIGSDAQVDQLWSIYPSHFQATVINKGYTKEQLKDYVRGKKCQDCSGLVCEIIGAPVQSSTTLIQNCTEYATPVDAPGGWVQWKAGHIGQDQGDGTFIHTPTEMRSIEIGRVREYNWTKGGKSKYVDYAVEVNPQGFLDAVTTNDVSGWAWNGVNDTAIDVHIYVYDWNGKEVTRFATPADIYRADLKAAGIGNGKHGFKAKYDFNKLTPGTYTVKAFAISGNNPQLTNEKTIKITGYKSWVGEATTLVNVRMYPEPTAPKLAAWPRLGEGNLVDVLGIAYSSGGAKWYKIRIAGQYTGYVHSNYIRRV